jgi:hypothetical protein
VKKTQLSFLTEDKRKNMFNTNTMNKVTKKRVNLTIEPNIYQAFSKKTKENLQPKSWVIERLMENYITNNSK